MSEFNKPIQKSNVHPAVYNSCDPSMLWLWNFSLLMLYGKRNLFLLDCTSDSWQMTWSLCFSGAETKSRTDFLPNLFKFARDVAEACFHRCDNRTRTAAFIGPIRVSFVWPLIYSKTAWMKKEPRSVVVSSGAEKLSCVSICCSWTPTWFQNLDQYTSNENITARDMVCFHRDVSRFLTQEWVSFWNFILLGGLWISPIVLHHICPASVRMCLWWRAKTNCKAFWSTCRSLGNYSHKERHVSFSISEDFGWRSILSIFHSE